MNATGCATRSFRPTNFSTSVHFPWFGELAAKTDAIRGELIELLKDPGEALRPYVRMESGIGEN